MFLFQKTLNSSIMILKDEYKMQRCMTLFLPLTPVSIKILFVYTGYLRQYRILVTKMVKIIVVCKVKLDDRNKTVNVKVASKLRVFAHINSFHISMCINERTQFYFVITSSQKKTKKKFFVVCKFNEMISEAINIFFYTSVVKF